MLEEFSDDLASIRDQARRMLDNIATPDHLKGLLDQPSTFDQPLWQQAVELGWPCLSVPESAGGLELGWRGLSLLCEETGRVTASLPLMSNALAVHALIQSSHSEFDNLLKGLSSGDSIACLALNDPADSGIGQSPSASITNGKITGEKSLSAFAMVADYALTAANDNGTVGLYLVDLKQPGTERRATPAVDNARASASLSFQSAEAAFLGGPELLAEITSIAALCSAFEQISGARACLDMGTTYAKDRTAFGQPIGRFQGLKHKLAEMYCLIEIGFGCALDALAALESNSDDRHSLASAAYLAAIKAYGYAAQENLHIHGGMGVTWEAMPHHHYRRARTLALELGSPKSWQNRLTTSIGARHPQRNGDN